MHANSWVVFVAILAGQIGVLTGQDLTLPRKELDDLLKSLHETRVKELTTEQKSIQKAIVSGGKGFGDNRHDATINARKKLTEVENELANAKKMKPSPPELDVEQLAVGQIGTVYRMVRFDAATMADRPGPLPPPVALARIPPSESKQKVTVTVRQIIDGGSVFVTCAGQPLFLRMATPGLTVGRTITLYKPVKVVGTKPYNTSNGQANAFELAFFADGL